MAFVFSPDGTPGTIPDEQLQEAVKQGFVLRKPSQEEFVKAEAEASPFLAAGEGFMRGVTGGLSDKALVSLAGLEGKTQAEAGQVVKARKEENPIISTAAELGGVVGTGLATGGGASALVGGGVKGAAFEGGLYGMGTMVSESALENQELTVERLGAGLAGGALAGGVMHGALSGIGKGASAVVSKFGGKGLKDTLTKTADDLDWKMVTSGNPKLAQRNEEFRPFILSEGRRRGVLGTLGTAIDRETVAKATANNLEDIKRVGAEMDRLEEWVPLKDDKALREEFADFLKRRMSKYDSPIYEPARNFADKVIDDLRTKPRSWREAWGVQSDLFKQNVPDTASGEVREDLRQAIRDFVFDEVASGKNKAATILAGVEPKGLKTAPLKLTPAVPFKRPSTLNLSESEMSSGPLAVTETTESVVGGRPLPTISAAEGSEFYLPGQQVSRPLTVRLGEATPESVFQIPEQRRTLLGVQAAEGPALPSRAALADTPANAAEIEAMAQGWQGAPAQTVTLGAPADVGAGGLVTEVVTREAKTPAWFGAHLRQLGRETAASAFLEKALKSRLANVESGDLAGRISNLTVGGITGIATGNPLVAVAGMAANAQLRKRGGFMAATALRSIADSKVTSGVSKGLLNHFNQVLAVAPEVLGAYRYPIAKAAAMGADALVAEHVRLASGPYGQDYLARAGLPVESPEEVDAAGRKLAVLDAIQATADAQGADMDAAIDGVFGSARGRKGALSAPVSAKDFAKYRDSLQADVTMPERVFEQVPPELQAIAPAAAGQAAAVALRGKQFLLSKAPRSPYEGMPESIRPEWKPSAADLDKFSQYKEAVESPGRVLKNMAAGYVSPEQVEALKAVYPVIYSDLQQKMGERLATWQKPLSYQQKLALSAVFGPKVLGMTPQQVAVIQQSQTLAKGQDSGQGSPMKRPDGRQDVNEAQMQTEAEKLEAR